jgi:hypothetical protein
MPPSLLTLSCIVAPFFLGLALTKVLPKDLFRKAAILSDSGINQEDHDMIENNTNLNKDYDIRQLLSSVSLVVHRNGESDPCGSTRNLWSDTFLYVAEQHGIKYEDLKDLDMYEMDSLLTETLSISDSENILLDECGPEQPPESIKGDQREVWGRGLDYKIDDVSNAFLNFCDMGEDHTPILPDHDDLEPIQTENDAGTIETLPCHFHTREGRRITSLNDLLDMIQESKNRQTSKREEQCSVSEDGSTVCVSTSKNDMEHDAILHLYAVPAGRIFMFAPSHVGEEFHLDYLDNVLKKHIFLKVLSVSPRVFDVINFFSKEESDDIVTKALNEKSESHRIKRSSTGASGYNVNSQRTSENGFDTHGKTAMAVKKRCFKMLGFEKYDESFADGLQVLRYNKTTAYVSHMDWIDDPGKTNEHDFESSHVGTNRFATVLLYMSDLGPNDGGETVFNHAWPTDVPENERISAKEALNQIRATGELSFLKPNSWEERMVADCRSHLAVRPHSARAVLFYSQHPNGEEDLSSLHGACPVLGDDVQKWAANLWVWNGPRNGYSGAPMNPYFESSNESETPPDQLKATFINTGKDPTFKDVDIYFQDTYWAPIGFGSKPVYVNTYEGHEWNIKNKQGMTLRQFIIDNEEVQTYKI